MSHKPVSRREFLRALAAVAAGYASRPGLEWNPVSERNSPQPAALQPFSVQLHIHGNSNHNAGINTVWSGLPPTLQWQSDWADLLGLDTLWWSEHDVTMYPGIDFVVPLESGRLDPATWNVVDLDNPFVFSDADIPTTWYAQQMQAVITGAGFGSATLNGPELGWSMTAATDPSWFQYAPRTNEGGGINGHFLAKALLADVIITLDVWRGDIGPYQKCQVVVDLAWRQVRPGVLPKAVLQRIVYDLVELASSPIVAPSSVTIPTPVPNPRTWVTLELHVSRDAEQWLPTGLDNSIQDIRFLIGASDDQTAELGIRNLNVHSVQQDGPTNWMVGRQLAESCASSYPGLTAVYGVEVAVDIGLHFNVFLPDATNQLPDPNLTARQLTDWVHLLGGMASLNHPFGAGMGLIPNQDGRLVAVAEALIAEEVFGADMIEVYNVRRCDLEHHLRLWDILSANGYHVLGIGTTDSHGGPWSEYENYFVTWVWAAGPDQDSLLAGMFSRSMYFGSPFRFGAATLNYEAGGASMGGNTIVTGDRTAVSVQIAGDRSNWERRLRHYLIGPGTGLVNLVGTPQEPWMVFPGNEVEIDTRHSSFIRIEIWDTTGGMPVAFGQTIVLLRDGAERVYLPVIVK